MAATAVPAFTCGEGAANSGLAKSDPRFGYNFVKAIINILQEQGSSEGESIRGNASSCNKGEGPPV
jgi:hypothetical protein